MYADNQANTGQAVNGTVVSHNCGMSSMLLGGNSSDEDEDPPDECSSKLPRRL